MAVSTYLGGMLRLPFLSIFLFLATFSQAQGNGNGRVAPEIPPVLTDRVIGVPNLQHVSLPSIKSALAGLTGVIWAGYCEDQHYIMLRVNRKMVPEDKTITDVLLAVDSTLKLYYKLINIQQAVQACVDGEKALTK